MMVVLPFMRLRPCHALLPFLALFCVKVGGAEPSPPRTRIMGISHAAIHVSDTAKVQDALMGAQR